METTIDQTNESATPQPSSSQASLAPRIDWKKIDWLTVLPYAIAVLLLAKLAWPMLVWWSWEFTKPESYYAHAPIIPFLVLLMLWYRREALQAVPKALDWKGLLLLVPALGLLIFAIKMQAQAMMSTGFLLSIIGGVWFSLGARFVRAAAFPLAFLFLMAPLPGPVLNDATLKLQMTSTLFANKLLHLMTFHTALNGNVISMDDYSLFVDVPCSGFKLLLSLLTFSAAFAYLLDGSAKKRVLLFLFCIPLALVVNAVRIALIGVVGECIGSSAAHVFHDWSGIITLILGFTALFSLAKVFGCRNFAGLAIF